MQPSTNGHQRRTPPEETTRAVAMGCAVSLIAVGIASIIVATALAIALIR
jgi:hypothetical protein